jgi:hypothetical protein
MRNAASVELSEGNWIKQGGQCRKAAGCLIVLVLK